MHGELVEKWSEYVYRRNTDAVRRFVEAYPARRSFAVQYDHFGHDYQFTRPLFADPDGVFEAGREALRQFVGRELGWSVDDDELTDVYLRVGGVPDHRTVELGSLRSTHVNELVAVEATVVETQPVKPKIRVAAFRCEKCDDVTRRTTQRGDQLRTTPKCPTCGSVGYLDLSTVHSEYVDSREIALADGSDAVESDRVTALLEHEQVQEFQTGDTVRLTGVPRVRRDDDSTIFDIWLETASLERVDGTAAEPVQSASGRPASRG